MPNKAKKKATNGEIKTPKADKRIPPDKILLEFLQKNKLTIIADEVPLLTNIVPGTIYVVDKRPRIRVYYADQIEATKKKVEGQKLDIVS